MIQRENEIKREVAKFFNKHGHIQKITSTSRYICWEIRGPGKSYYMYLGRGSGVEGIWWGQTRPPSDLRIKDKVLDFFRKHFIGLKLAKLALVPGDRIVEGHLERGPQKCYFAWFYRGRDSLFLFQNDLDVFCSWTGTTHYNRVLKREELIALFPGKKDQSSTKEVREIPTIEELLEKENLESWENGSSRKKTHFLEKKCEKIKIDLKKCQRSKVLRQLVNTHEFNEFGKCHIAGIKFNFPKEWGHYKKRDKVFQKIKSLEKGEKILEERLKITEESLKNKETKNRKKLKIITPLWHNKKRENKELPSEITEYLYKGLKVGLGKSANGNDFLRSKWASKEHYWFHIEGVPSAHLIIKITETSVLREEDYIALGTLLASHSKFKGEIIPLLMTKVKNLKGVKGKAGAVLYKKQKHLTVPFENGRLGDFQK